MPFVEYYRGMCYLRQMRTMDRDQGVTEKALEHFQRMVERYPNSSFAPMAQEKIRGCRESLAEHELYVADFYLDYYNAVAALARFRNILENYSDTKAFLTALSRLEDGFRQAERKDLSALVKKTLAYHQDRSASTKEIAKVTLLPPTLTADNPSLDAAQDKPFDHAQDRPSRSDPLFLLLTELKKLESSFNGAGKVSDGQTTDGGPTKSDKDVDSKNGFR